MQIRHGQELYELRVTQVGPTTPAGLAYHQIQAFRLSKHKFNTSTGGVDEVVEEIATAEIKTSALYGAPTLTHYLEDLRNQITAAEKARWQHRA